MLIEFCCPVCRAPLAIQKKTVGGQVNCPKCQKLILLPEESPLPRNGEDVPPFSPKTTHTGDRVAEAVGISVDPYRRDLETKSKLLDDAVDELHEQVLAAQDTRLRVELLRMRYQIIALRRFLAPQREAMARLAQLRVSWLNDHLAMGLREQAERTARYVEDLDAARDRASVVQEELAGRLAEQMNTRMYVLSLVAGIFLPLGFVTGLLGINVGLIVMTGIATLLVMRPDQER